MPITSEDFYVGKSLNVTISAFDRATKFAITGGTCTVDFFAPPKNPEDNPNDRVVDHTFSATFDSGLNAYSLNFSTVGWTAGVWSYRATLTDASSNTDWFYDTFVLKA